MTRKPMLPFPNLDTGRKTTSLVVRVRKSPKREELLRRGLKPNPRASGSPEINSLRALCRDGLAEEHPLGFYDLTETGIKAAVRLAGVK